ncbi:hypothetical protein [Dysgonomonas sp.]
MKELSNTTSDTDPLSDIAKFVRNALCAGLAPDEKDNIDQDQEPENN